MLGSLKTRNFQTSLNSTLKFWRSSIRWDQVSVALQIKRFLKIWFAQFLQACNLQNLTHKVMQIFAFFEDTLLQLRREFYQNLLEKWFFAVI